MTFFAEPESIWEVEWAGVVTAQQARSYKAIINNFRFGV